MQPRRMGWRRADPLETRCLPTRVFMPNFVTLGFGVPMQEVPIFFGRLGPSLGDGA